MEEERETPDSDLWRTKDSEPEEADEVKKGRRGVFDNDRHHLPKRLLGREGTKSFIAPETDIEKRGHPK